jgi:hypothetical protein
MIDFYRVVDTVVDTGASSALMLVFSGLAARKLAPQGSAAALSFGII